MATTYYACTGTVTQGNGANSGALSCSTGWQSYIPQQQNVEITGQLISYEQASSLISVLLTVAAVYAVFKILFRLLRY